MSEKIDSRPSSNRKDVQYSRKWIERFVRGIKKTVITTLGIPLIAACSADSYQEPAADNLPDEPTKIGNVEDDASAVSPEEPLVSSNPTSTSNPETAVPSPTTETNPSATTEAVPTLPSIDRTDVPNSIKSGSPAQHLAIYLLENDAIADSLDNLQALPDTNVNGIPMQIGFSLWEGDKNTYNATIDNNPVVVFLPPVIHAIENGTYDPNSIENADISFVEGPEGLEFDRILATKIMYVEVDGELMSWTMDFAAVDNDGNVVAEKRKEKGEESESIIDGEWLVIGDDSENSAPDPDSYISLLEQEDVSSISYETFNMTHENGQEITINFSQTQIIHNGTQYLLDFVINDYDAYQLYMKQQVSRIINNGQIYAENIDNPQSALNLINLSDFDEIKIDIRTGTQSELPPTDQSYVYGSADNGGVGSVNTYYQVSNGSSELRLIINVRIPTQFFDDEEKTSYYFRRAITAGVERATIGPNRHVVTNGEFRIQVDDEGASLNHSLLIDNGDGPQAYLTEDDVIHVEVMKLAIGQ